MGLEILFLKEFDDRIERLAGAETLKEREGFEKKKMQIILCMRNPRSYLEGKTEYHLPIIQ